MKNLSRVIWGIILIAVGVVFALDVFEVIDASKYVFFNGWWTLFIIVPCFISIITEKPNLGNLIGFLIGVALLLNAQEIVGFDLIVKLLVPALIIIVGLRMIFSISTKKSRVINQRINELKQNGNQKEKRSYNAVFSGQDISFAGEKVEIVTINAIFGGADCDLRGAIFEGDAVITANVVFGGVDIIVPEGVNVKVKSSAIFGGVDNMCRRADIPFAPTVYINANAIFGGVDVK